LIDHILADIAAKKLPERKAPEAVRERIFPFIATMSGHMNQARYVKMIRERVLQSEREESIWEDLKKISTQMQQAQTNPGNAGQPGGQRGTMLSTAQASRLDMISRKLFGLLAYFDREKTFDTSGTYAAIKSIAGDDRYNNLISAIEPVKDELALEAEIFFGNGHDSIKIQKHIDELLASFEHDLVEQDLVKMMSEKRYDEESVKKIQALTHRREKLRDIMAK
jgi:hypothetical protein